MAYAHFEDHNEIIISPEIGTNPLNLIDLINGSLIRHQLRIHDQDTQGPGDEELQLLNERSQLIKSQEIQKITSTALTSHEIRLKTLAILQRTVRALEQQMTSEASGRGNEDEENVIREMIVKYNQLFQSDMSSSSSTFSPSSLATLQETTYGIELFLCRVQTGDMRSVFGLGLGGDRRRVQ